MQIKITPQYLASQGLSPTFPKRFWAKVNKDGPVPKHMPHLGKCWVWTGYRQYGGYGKIFRSTSNESMMLSSRASWILNRGPVPAELMVLHHCDHPPCVRPSHLFAGTKQDNSDDAKRKGRTAMCLKRGSDNGRHVLMESEVIEIRRLYSNGGISQLSLAIKFGVSERNIFFIVHRLHWKHV